MARRGAACTVSSMQRQRPRSPATSLLGQPQDRDALAVLAPQPIDALLPLRLLVLCSRSARLAGGGVMVHHDVEVLDQVLVTVMLQRAQLVPGVRVDRSTLSSSRDAASDTSKEPWAECRPKGPLRHAAHAHLDVIMPVLPQARVRASAHLNVRHASAGCTQSLCSSHPARVSTVTVGMSGWP